jgi:hypothetical protein
MAGKGLEQPSQELADELERIYLLPPERLEVEKENAYALMKNLDWGRLVKNYYRAYGIALERNCKELQIQARKRTDGA